MEGNWMIPSDLWRVPEPLPRRIALFDHKRVECLCRMKRGRRVPLLCRITSGTDSVTAAGKWTTCVCARSKSRTSDNRPDESVSTVRDAFPNPIAGYSHAAEWQERVIVDETRDARVDVTAGSTIAHAGRQTARCAGNGRSDREFRADRSPMRRRTTMRARMAADERTRRFLPPRKCWFWRVELN
jgi:hypothetical protein